MAKEWKAKTFKSGNSVALRLPKGLGFQDGDEVRVVTHSDGSCSFWKETDAKRIFLGLYGSMSDDFMKGGRGDIDQGERRRDDPSHNVKLG